MILPDVVWHVFSVESGGYNKVKKKEGGGVGVWGAPSPPLFQLDSCLLHALVM